MPSLSVCSQGVATSSQPSRRTGDGHGRVTSKAIVWVVAGLFAFLPLGEQARGETSTNPQGTIVAAGFGYQNGSDSVITVKVYDARSGAILSEDVYELSVKEENSGRPASKERIFAGGVGIDATDLSNFVIRVYDASTGAFQWQGRLNLSPGGAQGEEQLVSTAVRRHAIVTKVHAVDPPMSQPLFLLSALDSDTGRLVWQDEFTAVDMKVPPIPLATNPDGSDSVSAKLSHMFDFRIRMYDVGGKGMMWEDQLSQQEQEMEPDAPSAYNDQATVLPVWPSPAQEESLPESI